MWQHGTAVKSLARKQNKKIYFIFNIWKISKSIQLDFSLRGWVKRILCNYAGRPKSFIHCYTVFPQGRVRKACKPQQLNKASTLGGLFCHCLSFSRGRSRWSRGLSQAPTGVIWEEPGGSAVPAVTAWPARNAHTVPDTSTSSINQEQNHSTQD